MNFQVIKAFIDERVNALDEMPLIDFFREIRAIALPELEPKFMEFFLDIALKKGFVVDHHKLSEYGVVASDRSSNILDRIRTNELVENVDYEVGVLLDIQQNSQGAGGRPSTIYKFTNDGFKTLLMGARRYPGQTVDPIVYRKYFILLEKVLLLYNQYKIDFATKIIERLEIKSDSLSTKLDYANTQLESAHTKLENANTQLENANTQLENANTQLVSAHTKLDNAAMMLISAAEDRVIINEKLDSIRRIVIKLFEFVLRSNSVACRFKDAKFQHAMNDAQLTLNEAKWFPGMRMLKCLAIVAFSKEVDGETVITYKVMARNLTHSSFPARFKKLIDADLGRMHKIKVLSLITSDVNEEHTILSISGGFPDEASLSKKTKQAKVTYDGILTFKRCQREFQEVIDNLCRVRYHASTRERDAELDRRNNEIKETFDLLGHIDEYDKEFYDETNDLVQEFAECGFIPADIGYDYDIKSTNKRIPRRDIMHEGEVAILDEREYILSKLSRKLDSFNVLKKMKELRDNKKIDSALYNELAAAK